MPTVELAVANLEIELDFARQHKLYAIKLIHGYGSHGFGGAIFNAVKIYLNKQQKQNKISGIINGNQWRLENEKARALLYNSPDWANDEDFNHNNPGITIVIL
ncbi:MAG: hypothetical protein PHX09_00675 [Clostridia bacterium]|nr:hypothetical protein [Clostridia bacterium]MDD4685885.1 hypothetical protein [Clostridia bacterium]